MLNFKMQKYQNVITQVFQYKTSLVQLNIYLMKKNQRIKKSLMIFNVE